MQSAIYPGSFDPITLGHMDIIKRAANMFQHVYIVIMRNSKKASLFSEEERKKMIEIALEELGLANVSVEIGNGLTVNYARTKQVSVMIRGLRAAMDFEYELQIANINAFMAPEIETVFLATKPELSFISSTLVKEVAGAHEALEGLVPSSLIPYLEKAYGKE